MQAINDNNVRKKAFVDLFRNENGRSGRDLGLHFYDEPSDLLKNNQDTNFNEYEFLNIDSVSKRGHSLDKELTTKNYVVDSEGKITVPKFSQTLEHFIEISVGNDVYNLTE